MSQKRFWTVFMAFAAAALLTVAVAVPVAAGTSSSATETPTSDPNNTYDGTNNDVPYSSEAGATQKARIDDFNSYAIGTGSGGGFSPSTSVSLYSSELTLRVYFTGLPSNGLQRASVSMYSCNFTGQSATATFHKDEMYFDITGLKYSNDSGKTFSANLEGYGDFSFEIGECTLAATPTPTASPEPTETPAPRAPGLIVKSSSIGTESINAGDSFTLSLTVYATASGTEGITDATVSIAPEKGVVVASGSSTQYLGNMKPGSEQTVSFPMKAQADFTDGVSSVAVTLGGTGTTTGTAVTATNTTVSIPVNQPDRFAVNKVEVPESIMVGEEQTATITFVNMGKNPVSNLNFDFACDNCQEAKQSQYVGNLTAGTEDSVDFDLCPLEVGEMDGVITISYEATNGQTVTQTQQIHATVEEGMPSDEGMYSEMDVPADAPVGAAAWPLWMKVGIPVLIVAVAAGAVLLVRRRRAKKKAQQEEQDEDL